MRILLFVACLLVGFTASAQVVKFKGTKVTVTCGNGSSGTTLPNGIYELHVSGELSHLCWAATCASGGIARVPGNHGIMVSEPASQAVSCRSVGASGEVEFVAVDVVR